MGCAGAALLAPGRLGSATVPPPAVPTVNGTAALLKVRKVFRSGSKNEKANGGSALRPARSGTTTCSKFFVPELLFGSPPSTWLVAGYILNSFQSGCGGSRTASSAPRPAIFTRTVMGSPAATFVGPAVKASVKFPTAPEKVGGTFWSGSGST